MSWIRVFSWSAMDGLRKSSGSRRNGIPKEGTLTKTCHSDDAESIKGRCNRCPLFFFVWWAAIRLIRTLRRWSARRAEHDSRKPAQASTSGSGSCQPQSPLRPGEKAAMVESTYGKPPHHHFSFLFFPFCTNPCIRLQLGLNFSLPLTLMTASLIYLDTHHPNCHSRWPPRSTSDQYTPEHSCTKA